METVATMIPKHFLETLLDTEKLKYCFECGICTASCPMAELVPRRYNPRSLLEKIFFNPESVLAQQELWLCAWCYRCYKQCPQALKLPEIFLALRRLAVEKNYTQGFEDAVETIIKEVPLPLISFYVCFHPERNKLDKKLVENALERIAASYEHRKTEPQNQREQKIAVIGSGPAGLTAAYELKRKGYQITIFEALQEPGGMLRKCIPEYRLPKEMLNKEIQHIKDFGVEIRTNTMLGKDLSFNDLWQDGYKAIFIAVGAHKSRELGIEGEELDGVIHALDFLWKTNRKESVELGEKVAVIGGGNVAIDTARVALNEGAKDVIMLYRRTREEMPANPWEVREAEENGVKIEFLVAPKKFHGEKGKVKAIECVKMRLGELDATGRRRPIPIEGSEFKIDFDTVVLAIGENPDISFLPKEIELDKGNTIWVNPITLETSVEGVFAGGDVVTGPASVIEAIVAGKRAADSIHNYLQGNMEG